jgi:hypothetical protein
MMRFNTKIVSIVIWILLPGTVLMALSPAGSSKNIVLPDNPDEVVKYTRKLLVERLSVLAGCDYETAPGYAKVHLQLDSSLSEKLGTEGYRVETSPDKAVISAADSLGLRNGACGFIEWVMGQTTPGLIDKRNVDIDFPVTRGQAKAFLKKLPITEVEETPFYPVRMVELSCFALGVADLIDTDKGVQKYRNYEDVVGGFKGSAQLWKDWCDWCAKE